VVRRFRLELSPSPNGSTNVVFLSDLHWDTRSPAAAAGLIAAVNRQVPDWILIGGDMLRGPGHLPAVVDILGQLRATEGKLAVRGNRENLYPSLVGDTLAEALARADVRLLVNEAAPAHPGRPHFVGLDEPRHGSPDPACIRKARTDDRPVVVISHTPDTVAAVGMADAGDLVLAGHTHGGQIRLPLLGPIYTSSAYWRQFDRGWFTRADGALMFVTTGTGTTGHPPLRRRLLCPPEIAVLDLQI
jgi:predicted MPP superfamily phosphohydrolase